MSRLTANFSMYSLMSMRIMACSSSNRNSASARASSVLPTPVGPKNMNEPIGRFGSCSRAGEVAAALRLFELDAGSVELLLQLLGRGELCLLLLPAGGERARLLLQID